MRKVAIEMRGITKRFPRVVANDNVDFKVYKSEIHALVGENGAGKSTLMKVLYGLYQKDRGQIFIRGKEIDVSSPSVAIEQGIGMVHQHFMLIPPLTVAENVVLGQEPRKGKIFNDRKKAIKEVGQLSERYGLKVDPKAKVQDLSVGLEQRVEIIKVLYRGAEILILDEPTAVLTPQEVEELFHIMKSLKEEGKTIVFITHKLKEVMEISDRVTVMRDGKTVGVVETKKTTKEGLARMMVGREVLLKVEKKPPQMGRIVLEVKDLEAVNDRGLSALKGVSFKIRAGEILGIAGVEGNGQTELVEVLTGLRRAMKGRITFWNRDITNASPRKILESKIAHIPEDRHKRGLILDYSVENNLILGSHYRPPMTKGLRLNFKKISENALELIKKFDIRPANKEIPVSSLSGGNQQKAIVARELSRQPQLLIASQPTRGVDIGAIEFIHRKILEERDKGKAVLLVSAELSEVMSLSDRILVVYEGKIVGEVDPRKTT
ncbi:MAG TPA: ABC transporter ATP-binding protein, partial [bacterium]|nr:ABC transporter ATP-binding protein [bacterium]